MYGLVNQAIEDLITARFGADTWESVRRVAGVDVEVFVSMDSYPDEMTYRLVSAASDVLSLPSDQLLEAFGEHWTLFTSRKGYGELFALGGRSFKEFMLNLHSLHGRVALSYANLKPPSFWCTEVQDGHLRLHYQSSRAGLAPMVVGLIRGLGKMYATEVTVTHARKREDGEDHDEFDIEFRPAADSPAPRRRRLRHTR